MASLQQIYCALCTIPFNQHQYPMILPCGDSYCVQCINEMGKKGFNCNKCGSIINKNSSFPPNKLFFEMHASFREYVKTQRWERAGVNGDIKNGKVSLQLIKYDQKCVNPFCDNDRFECENRRQLFCTRKCQQYYDELH